MTVPQYTPVQLGQVVDELQRIVRELEALEEFARALGEDQWEPALREARCQIEKVEDGLLEACRRPRRVTP